MPYNLNACVHALVAEQAQRIPDAIAVADGQGSLTYSELNAKSNQIARYLQARGVGPEMMVGICMERSVDLVVACLGVLKAGGAYVPLDPTYPIERMALMLADARVPVLVTQERLRSSMAAHAPQLICLDTDWPCLAQESVENLPTQTSLQNLAYVIYTSGSTGKPKGVPIEHRGLLNLITWHQRAFAISPADRATQLAGLAFDASVWELWPYLAIGASVHIPDETTRVAPAHLRDWLLRHAITVCFLPTPLAEQAIDMAWPTETSLRFLLTGGDQLTRKPRPGLPFALINNYGPTENSVVSTSGPVLPGYQNCTLPDIGRPIDSVCAYILDTHLQPTPVGVPGELCIRSIGLARGYLNQPGLTAEKFVPDPFSLEPGARMYRTGDLASSRSDGTIEFLGRMDQQVKIRGFRIELGEIEAALKQHSRVRDAIVACESDGQGAPEKRLVTYVVPSIAGKPGSSSFIAELRTFLQTKLPDYMVPSAFVLLEALPLTPNGKVDRRALPAVEGYKTALELAEAPRTPDEIVLAKIWAKVLGCARVGIYDDFFALGGHSLLATRAIDLVNATFDRDVSPRLLFEAPTVAAFAQAIRSGTARPASLAPAELAADVVLDLSIEPPAITEQPLDTAPETIFLTGATGFLGAFLLHELLVQTKATIYCLVRAVNAQQAARRIQQTLIEYQIDYHDWHHRVIPVVGDLRDGRLGLSAQTFQHLAHTIDVIYHAGAQVHYLHPYDALKAANVQGTVEVLRLACAIRPKPVHYISTIAVALVGEGAACVREDDDLADCTSSKGYDQSKWVGEGIVRRARARGLPVAIYRPGRIGAHSHTGAGNPDDFFMRLLAGCIQIGLAPDIPLLENLIPIDYAAQAIVHLSKQPELVNKTFHLLNPKPIRWQWVVDVAQRSGYPLRLVPYAEWHNALTQAASSDLGQALLPLLTLVPEDEVAQWIDYLAKHVFDMRNTVAGLAGSEIRCPPIDAPLVQRMLANAVRRGVVAAPLLAHHLV